jgi:hypothetical protein
VHDEGSDGKYLPGTAGILPAHESPPPKENDAAVSNRIAFVFKTGASRAG